MSDLACIDGVELITEYLEGALPDAERRRLESHLENCPGCTEYLEQMRAVAGSLGGLRDEPVPPALRDSLLASFRRGQPYIVTIDGPVTAFAARLGAIEGAQLVRELPPRRVVVALRSGADRGRLAALPGVEAVVPDRLEHPTGRAIS